VATSSRQVQILNRLRADSSVRVRELASHFAVSESTIRRDLEELEKRNVLQRVYGGAVLDLPPGPAPAFTARAVASVDEKMQIGQLAAAWVKDGDVIFLDGGTTTQMIVPFLREHQRLTVVTCGLDIVAELAQHAHISTIVTGGELHAGSRSFTGVMALGALETYLRCDKAFITCGGVSARYGITNPILERIALKRKAMEISRQVAVIADGSKIGRVTLGHVAPMDAFQILFTNDSAPAKELQDIAALGVEVKTSAAL
jgi:DeoR family transcriptional regulator, fructose operon transcriptional repressor